MTRPPKRVGDDVFQRIAIAIDTMAGDPNAPKTKREVERRTGLSHDAVARAFRQDADQDEGRCGFQAPASRSRSCSVHGPFVPDGLRQA